MRISIYAGYRTELDKRFQEVMRNVKGNRSEFIKRAVVKHCSTEEERSEVDELRKRVEELEEMVRKD
jgi:polyhydroxyalkanoate synthesis regulator phasin